MPSNRFLPLLFISCLLGGFCQKGSAPPPPSDPHAPYDFTAQHGLVVAAHPLAAEAGLSILKQGGIIQITTILLDIELRSQFTG